MYASVVTEDRLATSLRALLAMAQKDEGALWLSDAAMAQRNRVYIEASIALGEYDSREPAPVTVLSSPPVVVRAEHRDGALALAVAS